jgi:4-hydroxybenzoate polyprenyltransferase
MTMPPTPNPPPPNPPPLVVDLDGTLIKTDLLWESLARLLRRNPLQLFAVLFWWTRGRAFLKKKLAARVTLDPATLPYNEPFLAFLREQKQAGRKLILATASDRQMAMPVAHHVGLFDDVLGSDGKTNLRGANKLKVLTEKFGERGFDYAGNAAPDLAVWLGAREAIVVNAGWLLVKRIERRVNPGLIFAPDLSFISALVRCLRPQQWIKNVIIFAPALAAHRLTELPLLLRVFWAFLVFCICASGVCMVNDIMDLDADRRHPAKKFHPFAAGNLPLPAGLVGGPLLLVTGLVMAIQLSWVFAGVTVLYLLLAVSYLWWVKSVVLLDVVFLVGLYTIRLVAGQAATGIVLSTWLLTFSLFIFLSLALVKRHVERCAAKQVEAGQYAGSGRGHEVRGLDVVVLSGAGSGCLATLVLALYANSQSATLLYAHPGRLWLGCPLLLYWISRIWLIARRGQMHDDPLVFALKDPASYIVVVLAFLILWLATGQ